MDRRTVLFIVSLSLTLFGVKAYFHNQDLERQHKWQQEQRVKKAQQQQAQVQPGKQKIASEKEPSKTIHNPEAYYVLENPTIQLVFSNQGASLVEINLPFPRTDQDPSVVLPIEFDQELMQTAPSAALFPLHEAQTSSGQKATQCLGGYYPLLRRNLANNATQTKKGFPAIHTAFNIVSDFPEMAELVYQVKKMTENSIVFESEQNHRKITKTYTLTGSTSTSLPYCFDLEIKIEGDSRGLWLTSGVPEVEWISGASTPTLKYRMTRNGKSEVQKIDLPSSSSTFSSLSPDWICNSNGFFGFIIDPLTETEPGFKVDRVAGTTAISRLVHIDKEHERFKPQELPGYEVLVPLKSNGGTTKFRIFAGPFAEDVLKQVDRATSELEGESSKDYIDCQTFHGWFAFISEPFAKMLLFLMKYFHSWTHSWAFAIVFITIVLRVLLYPLNAWSMRSMRQMQLIGPEMKAIQEKYKKEPQKAQMEIMALYRERGVNPLSGCLPMLLQMPFLIGMFDLLKSTFELRGVPFIPGWIDNLTSPDVLFRWDFSIPFIGNELHVLPIALGAIMLIQQQMQSSLPEDPSLWTEQQRQQKTMGNLMAVMFTVMFYHFPSGLNIYWLSSMALGIVQQWYTNTSIKKAEQAPQVSFKKQQKKRSFS